MHIRPIATATICAALLFILAGAATAVSGRNWSIEGEGLFQGEIKNLSATSGGELRLNFKMEKIESDALSLWCSTTDGKGDVYFGTGLKAGIFKLVEEKLEAIKIGDRYVSDLVVSAMACDGDDNLYAAILPSGRIIKAAPGGKAEEFVTLPEFYIWQIVFDKTGRMYVATGPAGRIYRVSGDGKNKTLVYDSDEDNIVSMAFDDTGDLYFGTSPGAIVMKITATELKKETPAAKVVYDFPMTDIRSMQFQGGILYVGVNKISEGGGYDFRQEFGEGYESGGDEPVVADFMGYEGSAIFRIDGRGDVEPLFSSHNPLTQIRVAGDVLYVAVTGENRIYAYDIKKREQSFFEIEERQAHTFELKDGRLNTIGTADPGTVYRIGDRVVEEGEYISKILDARTTARWGSLRWEGEKGLAIQTRSGDTEEHDSTWSEWSDKIVDSPGKIKSPSGRFIQFRVTWAAPGATLKKMDMSYITRNVRPFFIAVCVGEIMDDNGGNSSCYSRMMDDEEITGLPIGWKAVDPNEDKLEFDVFYREENEKRWKKANHEGAVTGNAFGLDTDLLPSGKYRIKVFASDRPSNPEGEHLDREIISEVFTIDHDGPLLGTLSAQTVKDITTVTGEARDAIGTVTRVKYSLDAKEWAPGGCRDGIFDSASEELKIIIEKAEVGEHTIVVRVYDDKDNMTATHLTFTISK